MKKIINAIKDFLYNITDYGIILAVVTLMALVLLWRFNILFNRDIEKEVIAINPPTVEEPTPPPITKPADPIDDTATDDTITDDTITDDTITDDTTTQIEPDKKPGTDNPSPGSIITVTIPSGAFPSKIGEILLEKGLITSKNDFLNSAVELELDTKLKQGTFDIKAGTSIDDIVRIIAKVK